MKAKPKDISFHYTNEQMVKDLISLLPLNQNDRVLDAGSGKNKVWYNNIPTYCHIEECEIEDGCDFLLMGTMLDKYSKGYDWIIGNPPYHIGWQFTEKASQLARKGFAWLVNNTEMNSLFTPRRLQIVKDNGFEITHIKVVADKRWFGRYYFLIFEKKKGFITWERKTY